MGLRGPKPLPVELKHLRGTAHVTRERNRRLAAVPPSSEPEQQPDTPRSVADYVSVAARYVDDVLSGRVIAGQWVRKAARRYLEMRARAEQPDCTFEFSEFHANDICDFAEQCPHIEGRWKTETVKLEPFQVFILVACYGFRVRETGLRLVTVVFFQVARKSAKSTLVAIAGLYHLAKEREPGAQVVCGATTGNQARIVFGVMQKMVRRSVWLRDLGLQAFANSITFEELGSHAKPINSKSSTQDGLNPSFISLDESHAQTFELRDVLISAMGARPDGVIWCPTTAGYDLTSVGYALRSTAMKILDGVVQSDHTFVALYELDDEDDWRDERVWIKAAPMIGITPKLEYVRRYCADAQATPGMQGEFETKICNRWLHSASRWGSVPQWDACADPKLKLEDFEFERCWIGVDLAERDDIAAVALNFWRGDVIVSFAFGFLPAMVINERARAVPEYHVWVTDEELEATTGDMTDYNRIEQFLRDVCKRFDVRSIVIERYGALQLTSNLTNDGLPARIEAKSAKVWTVPMRDLAVRLKTKKYRHSGQSFLRWQFSNVCAEKRRDGSVLATKDAPDSPNKIDAMDAIFLGLIDMLQEPTRAREPQVMVFGARQAAGR